MDGRRRPTRTMATDPEKAPAYMAQAVLGFNEQLERIGEVAVVVLLGGMLALAALPGRGPLVRPAAAPASSARSSVVAGPARRPRLAHAAGADRLVRHPRASARSTT